MRAFLNRREFMAAMLAGGVMTATGLWMPGEKLISIPSKKIFVPAGRLAWVQDGVQCYWDRGVVVRISEYFDLVVCGAKLTQDLDAGKIEAHSAMQR